ncbi:TPA: hypothetical protein DIV55_05770 [Patescibacteria group bacterium]|uniref:DUF433 domain-containing protein n=1 Tax=Candidatus Gottesmanbacteria bacterium GW2011_GWA1_43_11 TaxID=1618436 RepID=A0A0G1ERC3_9BACT|nr:MAG: hypothetical protein UV59_C0006G0052 [Candidatus Gottesmanbacteria bacterium GW2011_GWA1_43_11]HCS79215.1 hypothetical protein [Patescibacteria group bacterium]
MPKLKYITSSSGIMGGKPVISGTRIPISRILFLMKEGYTPELIQAQYPHVPLSTIEAAINEAISMFEQRLHVQ